MGSTSRHVIASLAAVAAVAFAPTDARAADAGGPCGSFDFSSGINCKIEVSSGCTGDCRFLTEEIACAGGCNISADSTCVNNCGTTCVQMCDPAHLDCFVGCHGECDQPTIDMCNQKSPGADCVNQAKAQCDIHCNDACKIPPSNCQEHCNKCCTGSCTVSVNFDCDVGCFLNTNKDCNIQCGKPEGAIYCNGQYVHASDVQACIAYLANQGVMVDVSARGSATCDLSGCHGGATSPVSGCAASPGTNVGLGAWAFGIAALAFTGVARRLSARRRRLRGVPLRRSA
jgi:hypothetical protein